jgi:amino acid adenylation domain-containing protein
MTSHSTSTDDALNAKRRSLVKALLEEGGARASIEKVQDRSSFPLSTGQERLWFLEQAAPGSPVYNIPTVIHIEGSLDAGALERSIRRLAERYEILRARFISTHDGPVSRIDPDAEFRLDRHRQAASGRREDRRQRALRTAIDYVRVPLDLEAGPLLKGLLLDVARDEYLLVIVLHHIIAESWSVAILLRELEAIYVEETGGTAAELAALPLQFGDYAVWERRNLDADVVRRDIEYWRAKLHGMAPLEGLTDRARPATQTQTGATIGQVLPATLARRVERFAHEHGVTAFVVTLAALYALLHRYTEQAVISVGSPISSRDREELQGLVGFFVSTVVLRADLAADMSFRELIAQTKKTVLDAMSHTAAPFELIVSELRTGRDVSRNPLFQVMFAFQNAPMPELELPGVRSSRVLTQGEVNTGTSKVDLSLMIEPGGQAWRLWAEYNTDLFEDWKVERLLANYATLLDDVLGNPAARLSAANALSVREREQSLVEWNATATAIPEGTVVDLIRAHAKRAPQSVAVREHGRELTYGDLNERSERLAAYLASRGVTRGAVVAVCLDRSCDLVAANLAVLKAGGAYAPIDPEYPAERVAFMVDDSQCALTITRSGLRSRLRGTAVFAIDDDWDLLPSTGDWVPPAIRADDLAYVIYTSGSTGVPKGVEIEHRGLSNLVAWHRRTYDLGAADVGTLVASPAFDASVWETWPYLAAGATVAIPDEETRVSPEELVRWLAREGVTITFLPTPLAEAVLPLRWPPESRLRALLTGGDVLHRVAAADLPFRLFNHYGPTENTVVSTYMEVAPGDDLVPPIGRPIDNTEAYVLDSRLQPVPVGVVGELCVTGAGLARGYRGRPELTAANFIANPIAGSPWPRLYRTGDSCRYMDDGRIRFEGRRDRQVKIRGHRIELGEIESVLNEQAGVRECAVIVRRNMAAGHDALVAYYVSEEREDAGITNIRKQLSAKLPQYMCPQFFVRLASLPKTKNGKVDREALPQPAPHKQRSEVQKPRTEPEAELAAIWSDVLGIDAIGVDDNFLDLGGNSLLAARVMHRIHERRGVKLNPLVLLSGSLRQTADAIQSAAPARDSRPPVSRLRRLVAALSSTLARR